MRPCSWTDNTLVIMLVLHLVGTAAGHKQGMHKDMEEFDPDEEPDENEANELNKPGFIQDAEHIREHLDKSIKFDPETATPEEIEFYFFKIHDTDDDQYLDGLELLGTLRHTINYAMDKQLEQKKTEEEISNVVQSFHRQLVRRVDRILVDEDKNVDGKLCYAEFASSRVARNHLRAAAKQINPNLPS